MSLNINQAKHYLSRLKAVFIRKRLSLFYLPYFFSFHNNMQIILQRINYSIYETLFTVAVCQFHLLNKKAPYYFQRSV